MSLGKGLESLIPPQRDSGQAQQNGSDDQGNAFAPQESIRQAQGEPPRPSPAFSGYHDESDPGPQILSFEFTEPDFVLTNSGGQAEPIRQAQDVPENFAAHAVTSNFVEEDSPPHPSREERSFPSREEVVEGHIFHIEVSKISPNPGQPRRNFNETALWELAKSIREFGFLQPIVVTRREKETDEGVDVEYELIAGERRLMASKLLGLEYVPAIIRNVDLEREKLELAVIENIQREDLNPVERARAFQRLQEEFRLTQREIAAKLGKSRETVANTVRLLDLPVYIQEALEKGQLTESHGRFLLAIDDPSAQKKLFDDILSQGLTTRDVKIRVQAAKPRKGKSLSDGVSPELKMLEEKLTTELGAPVRIEQGTNTGKITITFYSEEELRNIADKISGPED